MELKRCPFCGGKAEVLKVNYDRYRIITCNLCRIKFGILTRSGAFHTEQEAIEAWNRRADEKNYRA